MSDVLMRRMRVRARVRLAVWVHPSCTVSIDTFLSSVSHALTRPLRRAMHLAYRHGPWSQFVYDLTVFSIAPSVVERLMREESSDGVDAFTVSPDRLSRGDVGIKCTHVMGLVPRAWLHARVPMVRAQCLSVTEMTRRCALLDDMRFDGRDRPARSYARLVSSNERRDRTLMLGYYQRYLISHEFGHLMGLGHPSLRKVDASPHHPCMDQQTVHARADKLPIPVPSHLDFALQDDASLQFALDQIDALYGSRRDDER